MIPAFIGRQEELKKFEAALDNLTDDKPHIAFVYDATDKTEDKGGIGKTRLLQEFLRIAKLPKYEDAFLVIDEIFDFYEPVNRDRPSRISRIVRLLEEKAQTKAFDSFWKNINEYYSKNVSIEKVLQEYAFGYKELCQKTNKKVIRFFDTFEVAEKALNYLQAPYRFIEDDVLVNSFIVISGRNQPELAAPIWEGRKSQILEFPLQGFSDEEAQDYFVGAGYKNLEPQHIVNLNQKARGRPILLALIIDYLNNILKVEDILELAEQDFKEQLVVFINEFKNPPIGQAILAMAHLKHRCNAKFLRQFVKPNENFDKDYEVLKSLSFVRSLGARGNYIVLHDEMQKMVSDFILDKMYKDGSLRREISEQAIAFYDEEIKTLREVVPEEKLILEAEQWYHKLYFSRAKDLDYYFFELYDSKLEEGHLDYCFVLQGHLDDLRRLLNLSTRTENRIKLRAARLNTEKYQVTSNQYYYDLAKRFFDELVEDAKKRGGENYLGVVLCDYGTLQFYYRQLAHAEDTLRESVRILEQQAKKTDHGLFYFQGKSKNWLGYILYNQGKFTESIKVLEDAEKHLRQADDLVLKDLDISEGLKQLRQKQIDGWIAQVRGNLSRIYREVGDATKAIYYGESSLSRRRRLGNLKEVVRGLTTLGLIYMRKGEADKTLMLFQEAEGYLQNIPDPILEGRILTNKASLMFKRDLFSDLLVKHTRKTLRISMQALAVDQAEISKAKELLNSVITSLIRTNSRELATAYHNLGELNLMEEQYNEAIEHFENAVRVAEIGKDAYTFMNVLQRLVLAAYLRNDADAFEKFVQRFSAAQQELKNREETARYAIRYYITFGNFYYDKLFNGMVNEDFNKNFSTAFRSYTDAIVYARGHAESSIKFAQEVFAERTLELLKIQKEKGKEIPQNLSDQLLSDWQERHLDVIELQRYLDF